MASIAIVSTSHWPAAGGVQTYQRLLSFEIAKRHSVTVLAQLNHNGSNSVGELSYAQQRFDPYQDNGASVRCVAPGWLKRARLAPLAVLCVPRGARIKRRLRPILDRYYTWVWSRTLREKLAQFDLVHVFKPIYLGGACMDAARAMGIPCVCTPNIHIGQWLDDPFTMHRLSECDFVFSALECDRLYMIAHGVAAAKTQAVGVPFDASCQGDGAAFRRRFGLGSDPLVCFVGVKRAGKGYEKLLEAAPLVWNALPKTRFVLLGLHTEHSKVALSQAGDPRILDFGHVPAQDKHDALAACDVFCLPSTAESFGIVFLEAWHFGKPVIAGDIPSSRELIAGTGGGLSVPQTSKEIADAIVRLLRHPAERQRMGRSGFMAAQQYTAEKVGSRIRRIYEDLLGDTH
jgi:phosphatidylinositol alpha-1,6-mannosyltransferase